MKTNPLFTLTAAALIVAGMTSPLHAEPQGFFEMAPAAFGLTHPVLDAPFVNSRAN